MVYRDLPLDPLLKRQHRGADQPFELPHGILDRAIGWTAARTPAATPTQSGHPASAPRHGASRPVPA
eukprot:310138-Alexandrium_andersonii.AAC.1